MVLERYSLDVRSLALFRISLAITTLIQLPTRFDPYPFPFPHLISDHPSLQAALFIAAVPAALFMMVGYYSRLSTIVSFLLLVAVHPYEFLLLSSPNDTLPVLLMWAMFLPLGLSYSVDRAMNTAAEPLPIRVLSGVTLSFMAHRCLAYVFPGLLIAATVAKLPEHFLAALIVLLSSVVPLLLWSPIRNAKMRWVAIGFFAVRYVLEVAITQALFFPWLLIAVWSAFVPTSTWESLSRKLYGERELGPQRTELKIFYDADCGFCKKVVYLVRMLLVLPHTPLTTAQSIPEINQTMEAQNSWVIVDWQGHHYYRFEGIVYVVSLSPVFGIAAPLLRWTPIMSIGTQLYKWIATHRKIAGRFTRPFKFKPLTLQHPRWLSVAAILLLAFVIQLNFRHIPPESYWFYRWLS